MTRNVEEIDGNDDNEEDLIGFPIQDTDGSVHMKNIPPYFLPKFHGLRLELDYLLYSKVLPHWTPV